MYVQLMFNKVKTKSVDSMAVLFFFMRCSPVRSMPKFLRPGKKGLS